MRTDFGSTLAVLLVASAAFAHDLGVEVRIVGDLVKVEVFFDDGNPGVNARLRVTDATGRVIAEGQADAAGAWSFSKPSPGRFLITADTGDGHRQTIELAVPSDQAVADGAVQGDHRDTFTRTRWLGLTVGVLLILAIPLVARVVRRAAPEDRQRE